LLFSLFALFSLSGTREDVEEDKHAVLLQAPDDLFADRTDDARELRLGGGGGGSSGRRNDDEGFVVHEHAPVDGRIIGVPLRAACQLREAPGAAQGRVRRKARCRRRCCSRLSCCCCCCSCCFSSPSDVSLAEVLVVIVVSPGAVERRRGLRGRVRREVGVVGRGRRRGRSLPCGIEVEVEVVRLQCRCTAAAARRRWSRGVERCVPRSRSSSITRRRSDSHGLRRERRREHAHHREASNLESKGEENEKNHTVKKTIFLLAFSSLLTSPRSSLSLSLSLFLSPSCRGTRPTTSQTPSGTTSSSTRASVR